MTGGKELSLSDISTEMRNLFDGEMQKILVAAGVGDGENDVIESFGAGQIRVYPAGERVDEKTGEKIRYEEGITLRVGGIVQRVEASDLAVLAHKCKTVPALAEELNKRLTKERDLLKNLGF